MSEPKEKSLVFRINENGVGPELIRQVFLEKGWTEFKENSPDDSDWNLWWRTSRFRNSDYEQVESWQRLNHYPKTTAITKKDGLARNLKRMKGVYGPSVYNFSPLAFNLPNDYTKFVAEYTKHKEKSRKDQYWICKPADLSRGRGIFIIKDLSELQYDCNAVLQRYITNPLLISGYKFDLRIYVMVPSFHPLQVYIYEEGLVRFSTEKYDLSTLRNMFSHLTNTSINKFSPSYLADKERVGSGCKWTLTQLRHYFRQSNIDDVVVWGKIINIVILTVIIQASQAPNAANCFELYGFDIMIDENLKPWLLEVNFSPALSHDCPTDLVVKKPLLHDVIDMMGLTEQDKERGGKTSPRKQINKAYGIFQPRASPAMESPVRKSSGGPLPMIHKSNSITEAADEGSESVDAESEVVPIVPGCGLPSVQQSIIALDDPPQTSFVGSSSVCGEEESQSLYQSNSHESKVAHSNPSTHSGGPLKQRNTDLTNKGASRQYYNQSPYKTGQSDPYVIRGKYPLYKRDSKFSTHSDSGFSSYSGSSDNSDSVANVDDSVLLAQRRYYESLPRKSWEKSREGSPVDLRRAKPGLYGRGLKNRTPVTRVARMTLRPSNKAPVQAQTDNPSQQNQNQSVRTSLSKNSLPAGRTDASVTKRNIMTKSGTPNRSTQSHKWAQSRPWAKSKPTPITSADRASPKVGTKLPPSRVGDFVLVFPFTETTKKCSFSSYGNTAMKMVINECQAMLKERSKMMKSAEDSSDKDSQQTGQGPREGKSVPWLWAPLTDRAGTAH